MKIQSKDIWKDILAIKKKSPLIQNITNYVVMDISANMLLAIGASPIMAHAIDEVKEIVLLANSLILNIGTLSTPWIEAMQLAIKEANAKGIPVILDPVGIGASAYRKNAIAFILNSGKPSLIRGNAAEIVAFFDENITMQGVDSNVSSLEYCSYAKQLAIENRCVIWMSGAVDVITDGKNCILVYNGHPLMAKVTGMGCVASALAGAFLAVNKNYLFASVHAAICMGVVGEMAAKKSEGPGSFKTAVIDLIYTLSFEELSKKMRVEVL